jgi:UDP-glucose 4-epimerase
MLFGEDYDTRDGTCVRDYIHILDLADAHVLALKWLLDGKPSEIFNLGTGTGTTVRELVGTIERRSNRPFPLEPAPRRDGDAPSLVADNTKARQLLGWSPRYGLDDIIDHAWAWHANGAKTLQR